MVKRPRKSIKDDVARRGHHLYRTRVRPQLAREKKGRIVALDIDSADFEVADDVLGAAEKLLARRPGARVWLERIGYRTLRRFGAWHEEESAR